MKENSECFVEVGGSKNHLLKYMEDCATGNWKKESFRLLFICFSFSNISCSYIVGCSDDFVALWTEVVQIENQKNIK